MLQTGETSLLDKIKAYLDKEEWSYDFIEENNILRVPYSGDNGQWIAILRHFEDRGLIGCYSLMPFNVPTERRQVAAEMLAMMNYDMVMGCFELDIGDGEVRFRTTLPIDGDQVSDKLLEKLIFVNLTVTDHFFPALTSICEEGVTATAALGKLSVA